MKKLNRINKIIVSTLFASALVACGGGAERQSIPLPQKQPPVAQ